MKKSAPFALALLTCLLPAAFAQRQAPPTNAETPWVQLAKLSVADLRAYGNGNSVGISGNVIVVGAASGTLASVYVMPAGGWGNMTASATLVPSDSTTGNGFGTSVAIIGNTIAVGAPNAAPNSSGAVYVFVEPKGGWQGKLTETAKLTTSDATRGSSAGMSVGLSADTIVAGAPYQSNELGGAYVFAKPATGWLNATQTARLTPSDGQSGEDFGISVSVSGSVVVIGSPYETVGANTNQGAAYVYVEPPAGWGNSTQTAKLTSSDGQQYDYFGSSVSISGGTIAVGSLNASSGLNLYEGAAYVFVQASGGWSNTTQTAKLISTNPSGGDELGASIAVNGNFVVAGAPRFSHSPGNNYSPFSGEGAAYVFVKPATGWANEGQSATLTGSDARMGAKLGTSVAIDGSTMVSGALFNNYNIGAAYVFTPFTGQ